MLGFSEFLEFLEEIKTDYHGMERVKSVFLKAAKATCDFYIENSALDGIPYWDIGAPELYKLGKYQDSPADPFNDFEPVDSSAAAVGAQALLRLGRSLEKKEPEAAKKYFQAGMTILSTLLSDVYLATDKKHQGILLHTVYHRPNGWDYIPAGKKIPCGESGMWGDYHMTELCLLAQRILENGYYTFYQGLC